MSIEIRELDTLLESYLKGRKIVKSFAKNLTEPGENYGSLMLSVDVTLDDGTERNFVAKMVPPNEFIQKIFNSAVTFPAEIALYRTIVPTLQRFLIDENSDFVVDFAATYYGSRINLTNDPDQIVDVDGALILENLTFKNYTTMDRTEGIDLEGSKLVLEKLAQMHALSLGLKLKKPDVFESKIKPMLNQVPFYENIGPENRAKMSASVLSNIEKIPACAKYLDRIKTLLETFTTIEPKEPWATIVHMDCWVNNVMFRIDEASGKATDCKLVDFQIVEYGSPAQDLVFFLFSSIQNHILLDNYDNLIRFYHDCVIKYLHYSNVKDLDKEFNFESLKDEIKIAAIHSEFQHISWMLAPIFTEKQHAKSVAELDENWDSMDAEPSQKHIDKITFVVEQFVQRGWI